MFYCRLNNTGPDVSTGKAQISFYYQNQKLLKLQKELQATKQIINDRQSWSDRSLRVVLWRS